MSVSAKTCELCCSVGGELLWESSLCRVVHIADANYPGFCRVILNRHEREMTDLSAEEQQQMMRVVFSVEAALRRVVNPEKVNLASFGNVTPHVHWHVIPRWRNDRCFPNPIWGEACRVSDMTRAKIELSCLQAELVTFLGKPIETSRECLS